MGRTGFLAVVAAVAVVNGVLAAFMPPAEDELYYWCWAQDLHLSYYDHPPLSAYLIRLSTEMFGNSPLALRLPACLANAAVFLLLARLCRGYGLLACAALTPLSVVGGVLITPDTPLLLCWAAYAVWLADTHRRLDADAPPRWLIGGLILGLGVLSKYTMGLAVPAAACSFLGSRPWRRWIGGYLAHLGVAFLVASPILIHNIRLQFAPLLFQWRHVMAGGGTAPTVAHFPAFVLGQFLFIGTVPFTLLPWALWQRRRLTADPTLRACFWLYAFPLCFFLAKATRGHLEANWAAVAYLSFWPLAGVWLASFPRPRLGRAAVAAGFAPALILTGLALAHFTIPLAAVPPRMDRVTRLAAQMKVAQTAAAAVRALPERPEHVYAATYQWTAYLRYAGLPAEQVPGVERDSQFTTCPVPLPRTGPLWVVAQKSLPAEVTVGYGPPEVVALFPMRVRGELHTYYMLFRYPRVDDPNAAAARTPRPGRGG